MTNILLKNRFKTNSTEYHMSMSALDMYVVKRNGSEEILSYKKILERVCLSFK